MHSLIMKEKKTHFQKRQIITTSDSETICLGQSLGAQLKKGDVLNVIGELGAGKTTFMKGVALGLGVKNALKEVGSPTFVLMREYKGREWLFHVDLYRLHADIEQDIEQIRECIDARDGVVAIEWGDKHKALFPQKHLRIELEHVSVNQPMQRKIT